jgi:hypothetical protein
VERPPREIEAAEIPRPGQDAEPSGQAKEDAGGRRRIDDPAGMTAEDVRRMARLTAHRGASRRSTIGPLSR